MKKSNRRLANRYLNLLEAALVGTLYGDPPNDTWSGKQYDARARALGHDWPSLAHTMIGTMRMRNLRHLCEEAIFNEIPGDFVETGAEFPADAGDTLHTRDQLAVSRAEVEENFRRYGLLDDKIVFLEGWFKDTLPNAPIDKIAVLRLDGDMYESTIQALDSLYHKVSPGGAVIIDDYFLKACAEAVTDFRNKHGIVAPLISHRHLCRVVASRSIVFLQYLTATARRGGLAPKARNA